ncbi:MAG: HisA/HisF-related TIM barrel protein, partial [Candidatus Limnocylindrales bacterium]
MACDLARFDLLAAIDLRGGRVVRLREGDFARETAYSKDPADVARGFVERGVLWLHVVDLDGARAGERAQIPDEWLKKEFL